jgi:ribosome-associated heat shock protein Hsp15
MDNPSASMRLDKWLWAARFFKTRQLATEAINGGKVHLNGQRSKPGKEVHIGTRLRIHKGSLEWDIEVLALSKQRRPAAEAVRWYAETASSKNRREQHLEEQRLLRSAHPHTAAAGKPNKKDRRMIHRFTNKAE